MKTMNIVLSGDDNYLCYMLTTMINVRRFLEDDVHTHFHILYSGSSHEELGTLETFAQEEMTNTAITIFPVRKKYKEELTKLSLYSHKGHHVSFGAYALYFVAEAFSDIDKALYLDLDICVLDNLLPLYETPLGDNYAAAVRHPENAYMHHIRKCSNGMLFKDYFEAFFERKDCKGYFNTGILLLNLQKMREDNCASKFIGEMERIGLETFKAEIEYHNQDFINSVFYGKTVFLDHKYNINTTGVKVLAKLEKEVDKETFQKYKKAFNNPAIVHTMGKKKVWDLATFENNHIWWECAKETPFYDEIISRKEKAEQSKKNKKI